jgi:hypothetical protein
MIVGKLKSRIQSHYGHHNSHCFPTVCLKFLGSQLGRVEHHILEVYDSGKTKVPNSESLCPP